MYEAAHDEWEQTGTNHFAGKSSLDDFIEAVQDRMGEKWEERFIDMLMPFYFRCKVSGMVPRFDQLTEQEAKVRSEQAANVKAHRDECVKRVRAADVDEQKRKKALYTGNLDSKIRRAEHRVQRAAVRKAQIEDRQFSAD